MSPPLPLMAPAKTLLPVLPVLSVKLFKPTLPAPARLPTAWSPLKARVAPLFTCNTGKATRRCAEASVSVPLSTTTLPAVAVPASVLLPRVVSKAAARLASARPPSISVLVVLSVPLPARVPASVRLATRSVALMTRPAPLATLTAMLSARRSAAPSVRLPPSTASVVAALRPSRRLLPALRSTPVPRSATTVPLSSE